MPLDNKISNIIGVKLPEWVFNQLKTRSQKNSLNVRDNDNLLYLTNKTAWIRLVSSINIVNARDQEYFRNLGVNIQDETSLAKEFVLFGGTSRYLNPTGKQASYQLRSGLEGSYSVLGKGETQKYGYRPMPGITNVNIETQGRLGSIRQATVNFKCWDKSQLDIIDALYFKLGFTMFLEWGHTYYYPSQNPIGNLQTVDPNKVKSTELFSIDPFEEGLTKEEILKRIARNSRETEGNYDAMFGMVTNFNFVYNQEGGYDCTLKMIGLGVLGDSIKVNNPTNLPDILEEQIKQYNNILEQIERLKDSQNQPQLPSETDQTLTFDQIIKSYPSNRKEFKDSKGNSNYFVDTKEYASEILAIDRLNGFIPIDDVSNSQVILDVSKFYEIINSNKINFADPNYGNLDKNTFDILKSAFQQSYQNKNVAELSFDVILGAFTFGTGLLSSTLYSSLQSTDKISYNLSKVVYPEISYKTSFGSFYINIKRDTFAKVLESDSSISEGGINYSIDQSYKNFTVLNSDFEKALFSFLSSGKKIPISSIKKISATYEDGSTDTSTNIILKFNLEIKNYKSNKQDQSFPVTYSGKKDLGGRYQNVEVSKNISYYILPIEITISDTNLIKYFFVGNKQQPKDFISEDQIEFAKQEQQSLPQNPSSAATDSPLKSLSNLELILRTIQVHSLVKSIVKFNKDLDIGRQVVKIDLWDPNEKALGKTFLQQIFSQGIFSDYIQDLVDGKPDDAGYDTLSTGNYKETLEIQSKYGFATNLMANKEKLYELTDAPPYYGNVGKVLNRNFQPVDFKQLLTAYVVPYKIDQKIEEGTVLNHPVYIPFGQLLMFLNSNCTLYDNSVPVVYIDFNPNHSFCLSNPQQLSTDPFTAIIPFEGTDQDFPDLFNKNVLNDNKTDVLPLSGSSDTTPLFQPRSGGESNGDALSSEIPPFKFASGNSMNPYRGKIMNILLNIDYLMQVIKQFSLKDGENKVYLKSLLEQILFDINKSLGNFNALRLSYNDAGNVFQMIDDQVIPTDQREEQLQTISENTNLPLFGKDSIAKSLEIKSDVSSKLANMIAISANASVPAKSELSTDGTPFGFINYDLTDRYIPNRTSVTGSSINDAEKKSAIQFNNAIKSFYSSIAPAMDQVGFATNYYMEKMNSIKGHDQATRAAAMIPVSVNFTTDGISGLSMGQAFTIPRELLPYTYNIDRKGIDQENKNINKIGFAIVGLNHTIDNNSWNTSVRANMIFLKDARDFKETSKVEYKTIKFSGGVISSAAPATPLTRQEQKDNEKFTYNYLKNKGLVNYQIAAVMGAFREESSFNPLAFNQKENAFGIGQWRADRKQNLERLSNYKTLEGQLNFFWTEAGQRGDLQALQKSVNIQQAFNAMAKYERFSGYDEPGTSYYERRLATSKNYVNYIIS